MPITGEFWHFFFLGAAFLLIETLSVTRFALLFRLHLGRQLRRLHRDSAHGSARQSLGTPG